MKFLEVFASVFLFLSLSLLPGFAGAEQKASSGVTDAMLQHPDPADWLMWRRTLNSWGYSPLDQVNRGNVKKLALVWARPLSEGLQEGTPLVHDGIMYMPNPLDIIQAIKADSGEQIWQYRRQLPKDMKIPFPSINRNIAIYGNLIIDTSADEYVYALDKDTGKLAWQTRILDYLKDPSQESSGPIIADGKIISGRGCEPKGTPYACVITAHDARTGKELWRTSTIEKYGGKNDSWGGMPFEKRVHVGTWMVPSYDPKLKLIYFGTSVTAPAPNFMLAGNDKKYLYNNSTLALDVNTGKIVWYYQHLVDNWDMDHTFERMLVNTVVAPDKDAVKWINPDIKPGEKREVVTGIPGKTGVVYTLDARTGEFLWARPTIRQTVLKDINVHTGEITDNPEALFHEDGETKTICPGGDGGKNWPAGSYSPLTNAMYMPMQNTCTRITVQKSAAFESIYGFTPHTMIAPGVHDVGTVYAISVKTGKVLWKYQQRAGTTSTLATGGRLLFSGDVAGHFRALDQDTGKVLWDVNLGSQVTGYPITYEVNGRQYVAVSTGSGWATSGILGLTPELAAGTANMLFVFALPK